MDKPNSSAPRLHQWVNNLWYTDNKLALIFLPLSGVFFLLSSLRQLIQKYFPGQCIKFSVPVIIVGNITVGGAGKTPMVIHLAKELSTLGYRVGVSSRGYGRQDKHTLVVTEAHSSIDVGDEPLLILANTQSSVVVGNNRKENIHKLIDVCDCNVVICDDGLQDYRFEHDVEIIMIDGQRLFGNGYLLPAGPLRESVQRLNSSDFNVVTTKQLPSVSADFMLLQCNVAKKLGNTDKFIELSSMSGKKVHAIAGIANPDRFFSMLEVFGIELIRHPMPDHYDYSVSDLEFNDDLPIFMTEKDAVKCQHISSSNCWFIPIETTLSDTFITRVHDIIKR